MPLIISTRTYPLSQCVHYSAGERCPHTALVAFRLENLKYILPQCPLHAPDFESGYPGLRVTRYRLV